MLSNYVIIITWLDHDQYYTNKNAAGILQYLGQSLTKDEVSIESIIAITLLAGKPNIRITRHDEERSRYVIVVAIMYSGRIKTINRKNYLLTFCTRKKII